MFKIALKISAISLLFFIISPQLSAGPLKVSPKHAEQETSNSHPLSRAVPVKARELRRLIALSKRGEWAFLGIGWLVANGQLKPLDLPQPLLYPCPVAFFNARNTVIYARGEATGTSGVLGIFDVNTSEYRDIASLSEQPHVPAPSPNNQDVAYVTARGRLAVVDLNTKEVTEIAPAWKSTPSWSPNGQYIAFEKNKERDQGWGYSEVAVASVHSGTVTVLDRGRFPSWSPRGDFIAYTDVDGKQLKIVNSQGTDSRVLKKNLAALNGPIEGPLIWSPDQTKLIFYRVKDDLSGEQHRKAYLLDIRSGGSSPLVSDQIILAWR